MSFVARGFSKKRKFFVLLSCLLAVAVFSTGFPTTMSGLAASDESSYDHVIVVDDGYTWDDLSFELDTNPNDSFLFKFDRSSPLVATERIAINSEVTLRCVNEEHTHTDVDIERSKDFHGHLFDVESGTLTVQCCISGGSYKTNGLLLYDSSGNKITDSTKLKSLWKTLRDDHQYAPVNTQYYGRALVKVSGGNFYLNTGTFSGVLKYNYNPYSSSNPNKYDSSDSDRDNFSNEKMDVAVEETVTLKDGTTVKIPYYNLPCEKLKDGTYAAESAGAVFVKNESAEGAYIESGSIYGCAADEGGALEFYAISEAEIGCISGGVIYKNYAREEGGAINLYSKIETTPTDTAQLNILGGTIRHNRAQKGGAIATFYGAYLEILGGLIHDNFAQTDGGALYLNGGESNNTSSVFGPEGGNAVITGGSIYNNTAGSNGGGIATGANAASSTSANLLEIQGGNIYNNTATNGDGGGVYISSYTRFDMSTSDVYNNKALRGGGVYFTRAGEACTISGSSIYNNTADYGGGINSYRRAKLTLSNIKVFNNIANVSGGGVRSGSADIASSLTINNGFYYGNTNSGIYVVGGTATINGGKYGVSEYPDAYSYTVSRNTFSQIWIATDATVTINTTGYPRIVSTLLSNESIGANKGIVNKGKLIITNASANALYFYGTGTSVYNEGTIDVNGGPLIISSSGIDGLNTIQNRLGIHNAAAGTINLNAGNTQIAYCGNRGILNYGTINIASGKIHNNYTDDNGGGVYNSGVLNMSAGEIRNNGAEYGGGGVSNSGAFTLTGGSIHDNTAEYGGAGVYNTGGSSAFNMTGGVIHSNTANYGGGVYFTTAGKASTISGGSIHDNIAAYAGGGIYSYRATGVTVSGTAEIYNNTAQQGGAGVSNGGVFSMTGGSIYSNSAITEGGGIRNLGTTNITSGEVYSNIANNNKGNGIYTSGTSVLSMSKTAEINSDNEVYLADYAFINVPEKFTGDKNIRALVSGDNFELGRVIVKYGSTADAAGSEALYWDASKPVMNEQYFTLNESKNVLRSGDQGAAENTEAINNQDVFISAEYTVDFDMNPIGSMKDGTITHVVGSDEYVFSDLETNQINKSLYVKYWNEKLNFDVGHAITSVSDASFINWCLDANGDDNKYESDDVVSLSFDTNKDLTFYAMWSKLIDVDYDGNGATDGENWTEEKIDVNATYNLSEDSSAFARSALARTFSLRSRSIETSTYGSGLFSFTGWSFNSDAYSADFDFGDTVPASVLQNNTLDIDGRERDVATVYAVWDEYPTIEAVDRWFTLDDVKAGKVTLEELLSTASANDSDVGEKTDFEDRDDDGNFIRVDKEDFTIIDFNLEELKSFTTSGEVTVTYKAVDKVGNETYKTVTIHIVDKEQQVGDAVDKFVRFISFAFFKDSEDNYVPESEGGLDSNSVWLNDSQYEEVLSKALSNKKDKETNEWDFVYQTLNFNQEKIQEAKEYIKAHGIGNSDKDDALSNFYELYK